MKMLALLLAVLATSAVAAQEVCILPNGGNVQVIADAYPPGPTQPTFCQAFVDGVQVGGNVPVISSALIGASLVQCQPPQTPFLAGATGSVTCANPVSLPVRTGTYTVVLKAGNANGLGPDSAPIIVQSVTAFATAPGTPGNPRFR